MGFRKRHHGHDRRDCAADESVAQHDQEVAEGAAVGRAEVPASGDANEAGTGARSGCLPGLYVVGPARSPLTPSARSMCEPVAFRVACSPGA